MTINLGATPEASDKKGGRYCDYFPDARFKALDTRPHDHTDYIEGELMDPHQKYGRHDLVIAMSIVKHIDKPWKAAPVMSGLIASCGHIFVAMPWFYLTHDGDDFADHWRARPSGLAELFDDLESVRDAYFPSAILALRDRKTLLAPSRQHCGRPRGSVPQDLSHGQPLARVAVPHRGANGFQG
jgi:hypothetical protein